MAQAPVQSVSLGGDENINDQKASKSADELQGPLRTIPSTLEKTVTMFKSEPSVPNLQNDLSTKMYDVFCRNRTVDLYTTFFSLIGDDDISWCDDAVYRSSFIASAPMSGKQNERSMSGGAHTKTMNMHGLVRYEYKGCAIEECRKDGKVHGLRVVCTQVGLIYIRLHKNGERLAQLVLNNDLSESISACVDEGGLKLLRNHSHLIRDCFRDQKSTN
mmetsp:Transcript_34489/g.44461  ORF Transcript_34489/g.44461 Transcript_34489/m.44461 type:complete len:217 (-) Transcript_34489:310-960(-)